MNLVESATGNDNLPEQGNGKEEEEEGGRRTAGKESGIADETTTRDHAELSTNGGEDVGVRREEGGEEGGEEEVMADSPSPGGAGGPRSGGEHMGKVMSVGAPAGSWDPPPPALAPMGRGGQAEVPRGEKADEETNQDDARTEAIIKEEDRGDGGEEGPGSREREGKVKNVDAEADSAEQAPPGTASVASEQQHVEEAGSGALTSTQSAAAASSGTSPPPQGDDPVSAAAEEGGGGKSADKGSVDLAAEKEIVESSDPEEVNAAEKKKSKESKESKESSDRGDEASVVTSLGEEEEGTYPTAAEKSAPAAGANGGEEKPSDPRSTGEEDKPEGQGDVETAKKGGGKEEKDAAKESEEEKLMQLASSSRDSGSTEKSSQSAVDDDEDNRGSAAAGAVDRGLSPSAQEQQQSSEEEVKAREEVLGAVGDPSVITRDRVNAGVSGGVQKAARFAPWIVVLVAAAAASLWSLFMSKPTNLSPLSLISSDPAFSVITAARVQLPDGRHLAYREWGASWEDAKHTVIVAHGMVSSRRLGIPGVNPDLLKEYDVRLISYDRPGFGQSDPDPSRTLKSGAKDIAAFAKLVNVTHRFWVLGYSGGGPHALSAARFIPDDIEGVVLWAPVVNPYSPDLTAEEARSVWSQVPLKFEFMLARRAPWILTTYMERGFLPHLWQGIADLGMQVGKKDREFFKWHGLKTLQEDVRECLRQGRGNHVAEELRLYVSDWGFRLDDLNRNLTGTVDQVHDQILEGGEVGTAAASRSPRGDNQSASGCRTPGCSSPSTHGAESEDSSAEENGGGGRIGGGEKNASGDSATSSSVPQAGRSDEPRGSNSELEEVNVMTEDSVQSSETGDGGQKKREKSEEGERVVSDRSQPSLRSLSDLHLHVWHGTDDLLVPLAFSLHLKRMIPRLHLHLLSDHGHFSWFCYCDDCHREVLDSIFGKDTVTAAAHSGGDLQRGIRARWGGKPSSTGKKTTAATAGYDGAAEERRGAASSSAPTAPAEESPAAKESSLPGTTVPIA
ncbi:hypothetical protein CBR_g12738 [Chara braunii]|uniref:AB hydrolase-1 domain-containing protein n=1 Tax=Chara braunii TaxID=69332 RepID=A0A388KSJ9_CHABU|nr:hypothetical protein CBR_g12738 [Chara braunii]|eukprot:GBG73019.1 hypothetical protein CBR_g12738 [Chara braunii]